MTVEEKVRIFGSDLDRELLLEEARDPSFSKRLEATLDLPDGERRVARSALKAVLNELDPRIFPETRGTWKRLRSMVPELMETILKEVRENGVPKTLRGLGELGQFEIIGSLVGSLAQAGAAVYTSYNQQKTQEYIAKQQLNAQMSQIQAQQSIARAQASMASAQASMNPVGSAVSSALDAIQTPIAGIPLWMIAAGIFLAFFAEKA